MQLQREQPEKHAIHAYDDNKVIVNGEYYTQSILVNQSEIYVFPELHTLQDIHPMTYLQKLSEQPEIVLIGYNGPNQFLSPEQYAHLTQAKMGVECMKVDAACRTFNVLLGELRKVCLLLVL